MGVGGDTAWTRSVLPRYYVAPGTHRWAVRLRPFSGRCPPSPPADLPPLPPELAAQLAALPAFEPRRSRSPLRACVLGVGWLALLLAFLFALPPLPLPFVGPDGEQPATVRPAALLAHFARLEPSPPRAGGKAAPSGRSALPSARRPPAAAKAAPLTAPFFRSVAAVEEPAVATGGGGDVAATGRHPTSDPRHPTDGRHAVAHVVTHSRSVAKSPLGAPRGASDAGFGGSMSSGAVAVAAGGGRP